MLPQGLRARACFFTHPSHIPKLSQLIGNERMPWAIVNPPNVAVEAIGHGARGVVVDFRPRHAGEESADSRDAAFCGGRW